MFALLFKTFEKVSGRARQIKKDLSVKWNFMDQCHQHKSTTADEKRKTLFVRVGNLVLEKNNKVTHTWASSYRTVRD